MFSEIKFMLKVFSNRRGERRAAIGLLWRALCAALLATSMGVALTGCGSGGVVPTPGVTSRALPADVATRKGINYQAYRTSRTEADLAAEVITPAMIQEDMNLLVAAGYNLIRVFDSSATPNTTRLLLQHIKTNNLNVKVYLGIWIQPGQEAANQAEIARGVALAKEFADIVIAVSVGNECLASWSYHKTTPAVLAAYIKTVRDQIAQPVTTDDYWGFFAKAAGEQDPKVILEAVDFVGMHSYPLLDTVPPAVAAWDWKQLSVPAASRATAMMDAALLEAKRTYTAVRSNMDSLGHTAKPIILSETGWKADPANREFNRAHPVNQKMYFDRLQAWGVESRNGAGPKAILPFAAFDEAWKQSDDKWGIFTAARKARYVIQSLLPQSTWDAGTYTAADAVYAPDETNATVTAARYTVYADLATNGEQVAPGLQWFGWDSNPATAFSGTVSGGTGELANYLEIAPSPKSWGWGIFAIPTTFNTNLSAFEASGRLNFSIKTTYPGKLEVGFLTGNSASGFDVYLPLSNTNADGYGYLNDGNWHQVSIPISAIKAYGGKAFGNENSATSVFDLTKVTNPFVLADRYAKTGKPDNTNNQTKIYVDAIYWSR